MSNVAFYDLETKKEYQNMIHVHRGLASIILTLMKENDNIQIMSIDDDIYGKRVYVNTNSDLIRIDFDFLKNKIYLKKGSKPYSEIYNIHVKNNLVPIGYMFSDENRNIIKKALFAGEDNIKYYELEDNTNHYAIVLDSKDKSFNDEEFIINLLRSQNQFDDIRILFKAIVNLVDINNIDIKLADAKGSNISISNGKVSTYVVYVDNDDHYDKIYIKDGVSFIDKKVTEEYSDEITSYVKKIGEYHGKEKR